MQWMMPEEKEEMMLHAVLQQQGCQTFALESVILNVII
jgi:hypothetical protein